MDVKREKELVKRYSLQLKEEKARQKEVRLSVWHLCYCSIWSFLLITFFPALIGEEEKARGALETSCREWTQSRDCASGASRKYPSVWMSLMTAVIIQFVKWSLFFCLLWIADSKYSKDQEDEEETTEKDWEERHPGSAAEVAEAECKCQRAKKQQGRPRSHLKTEIIKIHPFKTLS